MEMGDSAAKVMPLKHVDGSCGHQHATCIHFNLLLNWICALQTPPLLCCIFCIVLMHLPQAPATPMNSPQAQRLELFCEKNVSFYLFTRADTKFELAKQATYVLRDGFHRMGVQHILRTDPASVPLTSKQWGSVTGVEVTKAGINFNGMYVKTTN